MTISIKKGNDRNLAATVTNAAGAAVDITGWSVRFTVKKIDTDPDSSAVINKLITAFDTPTAGIMNIPIDGADTDTTDPGHYFFDIRVRDAANKEHSSDTGDFYIVHPVTDEV